MISILLVALAPFPTAAAPAQVGLVSAAGEGTAPEKICRRRIISAPGSGIVKRTRAQKICRTQAEWDRSRSSVER
jgi:hypothetical protein